MNLKTLILPAIYLQVLLSIYPHALSAQDVSAPLQTGMAGFMKDLKGQPIKNNESIVTEGSPFFNDEWMKGKIITPDGTYYDNLSLRINLLEKNVHFLNDEEQEMVLTGTVRDIILTDLVSGKQFWFTNLNGTCGMGSNDLAQVLDTGRANLYKTQYLQMAEYKPYGSATTEQKILASSKFHLVLDKHCDQVKSAQELWEILNNTKPGFTEKPKGRNTGKKLETELSGLCQLYNH